MTIETKLSSPGTVGQLKFQSLSEGRLPFLLALVEGHLSDSNPDQNQSSNFPFESATAAMLQMEPGEIGWFIQEKLKTGTVTEQHAALYVASIFGSKLTQLIEPIAEKLLSPHPTIRERATEAICTMGSTNKVILPFLTKNLVQGCSMELFRCGCRILWELGKDGLPLLSDLVGHSLKRPSRLIEIAQTLECIGRPAQEFAPQLMKWLDSSNSDLVMNSALALTECSNGDPKIHDELHSRAIEANGPVAACVFIAVERLRHSNDYASYVVRRAGVRDMSIMEALPALALDGSWSTRLRAVLAMRHLACSNPSVVNGLKVVREKEPLSGIRLRAEFALRQIHQRSLC